MSYRAPVSDIVFTLKTVAGLDDGVANGLYADLADGMAEATLEEAAKVAENVLAPLNWTGDRAGVKLANKEVTTAPGWTAAYTQWREAGWNTVTAPEDFGGMGMPQIMGVACNELWNSANMAFSLCPLLTVGAIEALHSHATEELQNTYLEKLVSGEWTGTMNLTEPQAGSDLNALRSKAEPQGDGTYKIFGQKIFITYGDHDMVENIIHLVLARLPDAPAGTRGISLFLVPKFMVNADGSLGKRNDVHCAGIEHKLGIHASPTCTMVFGDEGGAIGYLIGQENKGLACMFTMMNSARLNVGIQGVAIAERAYQHALAYATDRKQGLAAGDTPKGEGYQMSAIAQHPDVRRNLMTMKSMTQAARAICYMTAAALDVSHRSEDAQQAKRGAERAGLLTPIAKAFSTDIGNEVASIGVQIHGGMGFVEETGAAQFMRDARIAGIYEGTNGIQAIDLVQRKLPLSGGEAVALEMADMRAILADLRATNAPVFGATAQRLTDAVDSLERTTAYMFAALKNAPQDALAGATPYLRLWGYARGGTALAASALAAHRALQSGETDPALSGRISIARFFAENIANGSGGLELTVTEGAHSVHDSALALTA